MKQILFILLTISNVLSAQLDKTFYPVYRRPNSVVTPFSSDTLIVKRSESQLFEKVAVGNIFADCEHYYGVFYDSLTQLNSGTTVSNTVFFRTTRLAYGVSVVDGTKIKVDSGGIYSIGFTIEIDKTDGGLDDIDVWLSKDNIDVYQTVGRITVTNILDVHVLTWSYIVPMNANNYIQIKWSSADIDLRLSAFLGLTLPTRPNIPSATININRISN